MKLHLLSLIAIALCFAACDKDDDSITPDSAVAKAFSAKYPTASQVEWEKKYSYMTADFVYEQSEATAWFNDNGQWYMTETELRSIDRLPEAVRAAFQSSEYASWTTDDIDRLERPETENIYVIEVKNGKQELDLHYAEDGILIKAIPDNDNDDYKDYLPDTNPLPAAITEFISSHYPDARIIDTETEQGRTEVDIIHGNRSKEVAFNSKQEWENTHYDVTKSEVDNTVLQALAASEYKDYRIDDIEKYETPDGDYYTFELEQGEQEVNVKIDLSGTTISRI